MPVLTRRFALVAGGAAMLAGPARAEEFTYKDWRFDTDHVGSDLPKATVASLQAQVDIVEQVAIKPEIKAFFRTVPVFLDRRTVGGPGAYNFETRVMTLSLEPQPPRNPVFLHELLHAYHDQRLPGGRRNPELLAFYKAACTAGDYPANAYLYKNPAEFFAMCASVVIWGQAARPPFTRAAVREKLPKVYDWIVGEFGLQDA